MMKAFGYIYRIRCKTNGKSYVGQTINTIDDVRYIKRNPENLSTKQLADRLRADHYNVYNVVRGKTWKDINL